LKSIKDQRSQENQIMLNRLKIYDTDFKKNSNLLTCKSERLSTEEEQLSANIIVSEESEKSEESEEEGHIRKSNSENFAAPNLYGRKNGVSHEVLSASLFKFKTIEDSLKLLTNVKPSK